MSCPLCKSKNIKKRIEYMFLKFICNDCGEKFNISKEEQILELLESAKMQINEGAANAEERNCDIGDFVNAIKDIEEAISLCKVINS